MTLTINALHHLDFREATKKIDGYGIPSEEILSSWRTGTWDCSMLPERIHGLPTQTNQVRSRDYSRPALCYPGYKHDSYNEIHGDHLPKLIPRRLIGHRTAFLPSITFHFLSTPIQVVIFFRTRNIFRFYFRTGHLLLSRKRGF